MKNILITASIALAALLPASARGSLIDDSQTVETVGVFVRGMQICHQNEWRHLTITLEYNAALDSGAADTLAVKQYIRRFLEEYSHPADFWEVMNTKLVRSLAGSFPEMTTIKSTLSLAPDKTLHFPRASVVIYDKDAATLKESFEFTKLNYLICQETFRSLNLHVSWNLKSNPAPCDYPDYQWFDAAIEQFFQEHPVHYSQWRVLKGELQAYLLIKFPTTTAIDVEVTIAE